MDGYLRFLSEEWNKKTEVQMSFFCTGSVAFAALQDIINKIDFLGLKEFVKNSVCGFVGKSFCVRQKKFSQILVRRRI